MAATALRHDPSVLDVAELVEALAVDLDLGLSSAEAARRLAADGPTQLPVRRGIACWKRLPSPLVDYVNDDVHWLGDWLRGWGGYGREVTHRATGARRRA